MSTTTSVPGSRFGVVVTGPSRRRQAVTIDAEPGATVATLAEALAAELGETGPEPPTLFADGAPLPPDAPLDQSGLVHGALIGIDRPVVDRPRPATGLEVAVVGGLAGGPVAAGRAGEDLTVGRDPAADLPVDDPEVSREHLRVAVEDTGATVTDGGSRNGTRWAGFRLTGPEHLDTGDVVQVGESVVTVREAESRSPLLERGIEPGSVRANRPPRIHVPTPPRELLVPTEPEAPKGRRIPLLAVLAPLALGAILFKFIGPSPFLAFVLLSPLMMMANVVGDRRSGRKDHKVKMAEYRQAMADLDRNLEVLAARDERARRRAHPDPAALLAVAAGPTSRLWERRPDDPDFGHVRVGLADQPAEVRLRGGTNPADPNDRPEPPIARLVPVTVDLGEAGVLGVAGPRPALLATTRAVLAQLATLHAPRDLRVVLLTGAAEADDWTWLTWLPHLRPPSGGGWACRSLVAHDLPTGEARLAEIGRLIRDRTEAARSMLSAGTPAGPRILLVLDGARRLRPLRGLADALRDGPAVGVHALCLADDEASLPAECRATAVASVPSGSRLTVRRPGVEPIDDVLADGIRAADADRLARALAPIRELGGPGADGGSDLPERVRFLDLFGTHDPTADTVRAAWALSPSGRSTRATLGVSASGPFTVDLKADGPHALIAGTTGAGKSELLQTLVTSLALANRPEALTFVLVDYKGGSAFAHCARLPHCAGLITDLDGHLADRSLASLRAELTRRETILAAAGVKDIDDYWAAVERPDLARLVIVIDEFATLVEEVPDFVNGVVGIGMRGRSLGVHVVLATQRPAGVVTGDLRANVNLRISLRVADAQESRDVLEVPDAATIAKATPGRAWARSGHEDLTAFQTARVGGPRPVMLADPTAVPRVGIAPVALSSLASIADGPESVDDATDGPTDLGVLVEAIVAAADAEGTVGAVSPWLPPLPDLVDSTAIDTAAAGGAADPARPLRIPVGLVDRPEIQAQEPFVVDIEAAGTLALIGSARSGRSTALRTVAGALAAANAPDRLHLYAIDGGNRALGALSGLPHVGAVVPADDEDRLVRLVELLGAEVVRRQRLLASVGAGSPAEHRATAPEDAPPAIVVLVDGLEAYVARYQERDGGRLVERLEQLLREGPSAGVSFVVATDRLGFRHRLAAAVADRLVLRQADPDGYVSLGLGRRSVPADMPAGRGVWVASGHEVQLAVLGGDPAAAAQAAALANLAAAVRSDHPRPDPLRRPRRIDPLPARIEASEIDALRLVPAPEGDAVCTVAVGGDELAPIDVDLSDIGPGFLVAGPPRSGRSTALVDIVTSCAGRETGQRQVIIVTPRPSPLRELAGLPGVVAVLEPGPELADDLGEVLEDTEGALLIAIDDAEMLGDGPVVRVLENVVRIARDHDAVLAVAATTDDLLMARFRGWLADLRRSRSGLLLCPSSHLEGDVFDIKLPRSMTGGWPVGRGLLVVRGDHQLVQVPLAGPVPAAR